MTSVFTFGAPTLSAREGSELPGEPATALPADGSPAHLAWLLGPRPGRDGAPGHCVAIRPRTVPEPSLRNLGVLGSTLLPARLAIRPTALPPAAMGVLARLANALVERLPSAGALVAALPRLERELVVLAWADTVAALHHPPPSVAQHALSLVPGSSFEVSFSPDPTVRRLTRREGNNGLQRTERRVEVLVVGRRANPDWVSRTVEAAFAGHPIIDVDPPEDESWWGTERVVEVVAYPTDLDALAERLNQRLALSECGWCGAVIASKSCPFCRQPRRRRALEVESVA